jgi:hypothetical protein
MKKNKQRLVYLVLFLCFFGLFWLLKDEINKRFFKPKTELFFPLITTKEITALEINYNNQTLRLIRKNQSWLNQKDKEEIPADQAKIETLLTTLLKLKKDNPVSYNKTKYPQMGIEKNKIVIRSGNKSQTLYIGKPAGINSSYVKIDSDDKVYLTTDFSPELLNDFFQKEESNNPSKN